MDGTWDGPSGTMLLSSPTYAEDEPGAALAPEVSSRFRWTPIALLSVALTLATLWAGAATWFVVFRDDLLARVAAQEQALQVAYETRVATLQSALDRGAADRARTRDGIETRLAKLTERQTLIEKRQRLLERLGDGPVTTGSINASTYAAPAPQPEALPAPDPLELRTKGGDRAELRDLRSSIDVAVLESRLDATTSQQTRALNEIGDAAAKSAERFRWLIFGAGIDPSRILGSERGVGGPLVPLTADAFETALAKAERAKADEERLRRGVNDLPLRQPLRESYALSSQFGPRLDPFTRGMAMHTGLDMRSDFGSAARATAAGRVVAAEQAGGYGNMVEIDHGHGIVTRYAHLASFSVSPGQRVAAGAIVGRVGSTGRSTGNHLHYETRIDGEPVDPTPFLRAGEQLIFPD